jgi:hypothetical protein
VLLPPSTCRNRQVHTTVLASSGRLATRQRPGLGHAPFLVLTAQLLWLLCCLGSYGVVARTFAYQGFVIVAPVGAEKLLAIVLALIGMSFLLPRRLASPADYVIVGLFDISFVPFCAYWALSNQPWWQGLLVMVYWGLVLLVDQVPLRPTAQYVKGAQNIMFLVASGLTVLGGILIVAGGHLTLQLPLGDVYAVRTVWASEGSGMSMYLFPWLANVLLPLLLGHAWKNRRLCELLVLGFAAYMLFTSTGMKAYLFMPALVAVVLLVATWRPPSSFIPLGLGVFAGTMVLLDNITRSVTWSSLGVRRVFFVPAHLTSVYLEFFAANPVTHLSDSILLRGWLRYPYPMSVPHMIGAVLGQPATNANNGLVADGVANFGIWGGLVWAVVLGILMKLLRAVTERREDRPEAWAVTATWPIILLSSALTTSLLTHGLALGLLAAWSLRPNVQSQPLRRTIGQVPAAIGLAGGATSKRYGLQFASSPRPTSARDSCGRRCGEQVRARYADAWKESGGLLKRGQHADKG